MYYLFIVILEDCIYSTSVINLLDSFKIKYKHLKVMQKDKDKFCKNNNWTNVLVYPTVTHLCVANIPHCPYTLAGPQIDLTITNRPCVSHSGEKDDVLVP